MRSPREVIDALNAAVASKRMTSAEQKEWTRQFPDRRVYMNTLTCCWVDLDVIVDAIRNLERMEAEK